MPGIPWEVTEHVLCLVLGLKPAKQCLRRFDDKRRMAIGEEVAKLLAVGFIREVFHSDWLANPVLVKKRKPGNGECVLIILASTKYAQRITFLCHA